MSGFLGTDFLNCMLNDLTEAGSVGGPMKLCMSCGTNCSFDYKVTKSLHISCLVR